MCLMCFRQRVSLRSSCHMRMISRCWKSVNAFLERSRTTRDGKRVAFARSRRPRGARDRGGEPPRCALHRERETRPRDRRARVLRRSVAARHAPKSSHTSHVHRTPRMGKSPHRSQEWHSSRPCKHGSNISPFALGRGHEDSRVRLPADEPRASAVPGRREGLCPEQRVAVMFSRPTFVSPESND